MIAAQLRSPLRPISGNVQRSTTPATLQKDPNSAFTKSPSSKRNKSITKGENNNNAKKSAAKSDKKRRLSIDDVMFAVRLNPVAAEKYIPFSLNGTLQPNEFRQIVLAFRSPPKLANESVLDRTNISVNAMPSPRMSLVPSNRDSLMPNISTPHDRLLSFLEAADSPELILPKPIARSVSVSIAPMAAAMLSQSQSQSQSQSIVSSDGDNGEVAPVVPEEAFKPKRTLGRTPPQGTDDVLLEASNLSDTNDVTTGVNKALFEAEEVDRENDEVEAEQAIQTAEEATEGKEKSFTIENMEIQEDNREIPEEEGEGSDHEFEGASSESGSWSMADVQAAAEVVQRVQEQCQQSQDPVSSSHVAFLMAELDQLRKDLQAQKAEAAAQAVERIAMADRLEQVETRLASQQLLRRLDEEMQWLKDSDARLLAEQDALKLRREERAMRVTALCDPEEYDDHDEVQESEEEQDAVPVASEYVMQLQGYIRGPFDMPVVSDFPVSMMTGGGLYDDDDEFELPEFTDVLALSCPPVVSDSKVGSIALLAPIAVSAAYRSPVLAGREAVQESFVGARFGQFGSAFGAPLRNKAASPVVVSQSPPSPPAYTLTAAKPAMVSIETQCSDLNSSLFGAAATVDTIVDTDSVIHEYQLDADDVVASNEAEMDVACDDDFADMEVASYSPSVDIHDSAATVSCRDVLAARASTPEQKAKMQRRPRQVGNEEGDGEDQGQVDMGPGGTVRMVGNMRFIPLKVHRPRPLPVEVSPIDKTKLKSKGKVKGNRQSTSEEDKDTKENNEEGESVVAMPTLQKPRSRVSRTSNDVPAAKQKDESAEPLPSEPATASIVPARKPGRTSKKQSQSQPVIVQEPMIAAIAPVEPDSAVDASVPQPPLLLAAARRGGHRKQPKLAVDSASQSIAAVEAAVTPLAVAEVDATGEPDENTNTVSVTGNKAKGNKTSKRVRSPANVPPADPAPVLAMAEEQAKKKKRNVNASQSQPPSQPLTQDSSQPKNMTLIPPPLPAVRAPKAKSTTVTAKQSKKATTELAPLSTVAAAGSSHPTASDHAQFMSYCFARRPALQKQMPGLSTADCLAMMKKEWEDRSGQSHLGDIDSSSHGSTSSASAGGDAVIVAAPVPVVAIEKAKSKTKRGTKIVDSAANDSNNRPDRSAENNVTHTKAAAVMPGNMKLVPMKAPVSITSDVSNELAKEAEEIAGDKKKKSSKRDRKPTPVSAESLDPIESTMQVDRESAEVVGLLSRDLQLSPVMAAEQHEVDVYGDEVEHHDVQSIEIVVPQQPDNAKKSKARTSKGSKVPADTASTAAAGIKSKGRKHSTVATGKRSTMEADVDDDRLAAILAVPIAGAANKENLNVGSSGNQATDDEEELLSVPLAKKVKPSSSDEVTAGVMRLIDGASAVGVSRSRKPMLPEGEVMSSLLNTSVSTVRSMQSSYVSSALPKFTIPKLKPKK